MTKRTALIIGGSGGIGLATAKTLLNKGYKLFLTYHNEKRNIESTFDSESLSDIGLYSVDIRNEDSVSKAVSSILEEDNIDVVVYSVSSPITPKSLFDTKWETFQEHLEVQLKGLFNIISSLKSPIKEGRKIKFIVILTEACFGNPPSRLSPYVSSKYGLMGFVRSLVSELSRSNCTFNMVSPGAVDTKLLSNFPPKLLELLAENNPMKRIASPDDVAKVISFLASEDSDYLNGVNIPINGGRIII